MQTISRAILLAGSCSQAQEPSPNWIGENSLAQPLCQNMTGQGCNLPASPALWSPPSNVLCSFYIVSSRLCSVVPDRSVAAWSQSNFVICIDLMFEIWWIYVGLKWPHNTKIHVRDPCSLSNSTHRYIARQQPTFETQLVWRHRPKGSSFASSSANTGLLKSFLRKQRRRENKRLIWALLVGNGRCHSLNSGLWQPGHVARGSHFYAVYLYITVFVRCETGS